MNAVRSSLPWLVGGLLALGITWLACAPAAWLAPLLERASGHRLLIAAAEGSLWRGAASVGWSLSPDKACWLPGRIGWQISPWLLLGRADIVLDGPALGAGGLHASGNPARLQLAPGTLSLPLDAIAGCLPAPLDQLNGQLDLQWETLQLSLAGPRPSASGAFSARLSRLASPLVPGGPLGSYEIRTRLASDHLILKLATLEGPLQLRGSGTLGANAALGFSGSATAEAAAQQRLAPVLQTIGSRFGTLQNTIVAIDIRP